ncbi:MAG: hypothetical protein ACI93R_001674 [Flavobacteriales bacterium]|jgi:hypothetical protein
MPLRKNLLEAVNFPRYITNDRSLTDTYRYFFTGENIPSSMGSIFIYLLHLLHLLHLFIAKISNDSKLFRQLLGIVIFNNCLVPNNVHFN